jgi:hypothetical protein
MRAGGVMPYWILSIVVIACFTAMFTLLLFLVKQIRPKTFKFRAALTKWISLEVELQSQDLTNGDLPSAYPGGSNKRQQPYRPQKHTITQQHPPQLPG